ncbi:MAG: hypothetical protein JNJ57_18705 [Saprospiraceae bacterium]|nr:hypothetical protein [Saprospiraceae bacterium]
MQLRIYLLIFFSLLMFACDRKAPQPSGPLQAELLPANASPAQVKVTDINAWVEQGRFFVTGVCSNESAAWQQIWLKVEPLDAAGNALQIKGAPAVIIATFSSGVPPKGRTSFFEGWPLADFSGTPASCRISGAGALQKPAGPVLLVEQVGGVKMMAPNAPGQPATEEIAWQIGGVLNNPMPMEAQHLRFELMLYGTDNRLWFSMLLNPEDPQFKQLIALEKPGPLAGGEKRQVGIYAYYERLPQALKAQKIGRAELLAFDE